jgi:hypothetical protein
LKKRQTYNLGVILACISATHDRHWPDPPVVSVRAANTITFEDISKTDSEQE